MATVNLYQFSDGYCYNTDSLILAHFAKDFLKPHTRLLDIGAGCGILGLLCAREVPLKVEFVEIDSKSCALIEKNAHNAPFANDYTIHNTDILSLRLDEQNCFDTLITNPPFYHQGSIKSPNERKARAKAQDSLPLHLLCKKAKSLLKPRGNLVLCYDARESAKVFYALSNAGFHTQYARFVYPLINRPATLLVLNAKVDYKGALSILPPLFTHNSPNQQDNTKELHDIYAWASTFSLKVQSSDI